MEVRDILFQLERGRKERASLMVFPGLTRLWVVRNSGFKIDAIEVWYFGEIHDLDAGMDPGFVGPESHKTWGSPISEKEYEITNTGLGTKLKIYLEWEKNS